ncbi:hypothetical protein ACIRS1_05545 [Kitasatospora sp. NPDC101176]|uniref:hypothetical protein n=1 Tax=Kitasatospora sp. NPDC101176 TaxID=3364099 RepID=UPI0037F41320
MDHRLDQVIGPAAVTALVDGYRRRLERLDLLPTEAAQALAADAHRRACVYVLAAPGQFWRARSGGTAAVERMEVLAVTDDHLAGHLAFARSDEGALLVVPLDRLDSAYRLECWPADPDGGPGRRSGPPVPG